MPVMGVRGFQTVVASIPPAIPADSQWEETGFPSQALSKSQICEQNRCCYCLKLSSFGLVCYAKIGNQNILAEVVEE